MTWEESIYLTIAILIIILVIAIILTSIAIIIARFKNWIISKFEKRNEIQVEKPKFEYKYKKKYLLTKNEWYFYKSLKPIADKLNLMILSKIRLADLIDVAVDNDKEEYLRYFNLIKAKHIDFALAIPNNMKIVLLIELDDVSHIESKRQYNDLFINNICKKCGYKLLRTDNDVLLEDKIKNKITNN